MMANCQMNLLKSLAVFAYCANSLMVECWHSSQRLWFESMFALRLKSKSMRVSVLGCGNVGIAISADLSLSGHDVSLIKTSSSKEDIFEKIKNGNNAIWLKEEGKYKKSHIKEVTHDISKVADSEVVFVTIQSTYHEDLIRRISGYLKSSQIVICICSYMSSFYFAKYCNSLPIIAETTGPYLEGRVEEDDIHGIVFRVGCRLTKSPLSIYQVHRKDECMEKILKLYNGFSCDYNTLESALLNPNMVLHTVGSIMSIPRIEYSKGNFCMYREAYARGNEATLNIMLELDEEKKGVLRKLRCSPVDVFKAGGFLGDPKESFYSYSESNDRAISPTSVKSRYITEDVSQGLVLLESIATRIGTVVPVTSSLITLAEYALGVDFRANGRTIKKLGAEDYIENMYYL